ncbi:putative transmembrane anti-sigma factor [Leadbetterella byssophila DSM 17132]|uniref:Transmembrane anti-sigma factor n=1 Tax=Leadbetterella byssophila (strain DSM 17132 / JCM 16389 / KACC 11308 / NBRC 106382 / 4M15) TaxID=649349 RepID=E4RZ92_LEAB4|nr:HEAT repeat domain-containing protein [Leadbetterella byssophila]ADQ19210.1 putative transmembrane anti-sigma factor [Leadbetterella byssophila DSM 17132]
MNKLIDYLNGELNEAERAEVEQKLSTDPEFARECEETKALWDSLKLITIPQMDKSRFKHALEGYKQAEKPRFSWSGLWNKQPKMRLAYTFLLILIGLAGGWLLNENQNNEIAKVEEEVTSLKQEMVLTLIENPSATERIRAVNMSTEIPDANDKVIDALLSTLNNDPNDNVRLMTLEALIGFADHPKVRQGLVKSIVSQESPILQSAMADVMLNLQEKSSVKPLKSILKQEGLDSTVKDKVEKTIQQILI